MSERGSAMMDAAQDAASRWESLEEVITQRPLATVGLALSPAPDGVTAQVILPQASNRRGLLPRRSRGARKRLPGAAAMARDALFSLTFFQIEVAMFSD